MHRTFPLADALSVTTPKMLSHRHMDGLYELLDHMTGQDLFTHQLGAAADACKPALIEQHPFLADLQPPDNADQADLLAWLVEAERVHGEQVTVQPLTNWGRRDPIEDACDQVGAERVFLPFATDAPDKIAIQANRQAAAEKLTNLKAALARLGDAARLAARQMPKPSPANGVNLDKPEPSS
ncbi:DUF7736 domain-containing protein [Streptomyces decoyicus]|uniref:DUF7736 domain-containing protein n=1 Tax=Streptomyces decoyicus TaxID=249567 RepID=UPI0033BB131F